MWLNALCDWLMTPLPGKGEGGRGGPGSLAPVDGEALGRHGGRHALFSPQHATNGWIAQRSEAGRLDQQAATAALPVATHKSIFPWK
jgi:hypothetical protein